MATLLELCKIKHHAVRSDGAKFIDGVRNDSLDTSWLSVNSNGRVTLQKGLYDELLVVKGEVSDDQIKTWASMGAPFYDPTPIVQDSQIPSADEWNRKARTFYQASAPVATGIGDIWFDTSDHHHKYWWDGSSWQDADQQSLYASGAGGDIFFDKYGYKAVRKSDGKIMQHFDLETGSNYWEGDGVFKGRVEADEGYFHGDITGASGTFSGDLAARSIKAEWYEDIRNVLPYTGQDSLDADKPIVIPFYVPSETTKIVAAFLSAEARRYRAYSKSAPYDPSAFWDKQTSGTSFNSPTVTVTLNTTNADTGQTSLDHYHQYSDTHITTSASGGHSHAINTSAWPKLNTDYSAPDNHRHTLDSFVIPNNSGTHTHNTSNTTKDTGGSQRSSVLDPNNLSHNHSYERVTGATLSNFTNHHHDYDPAHDHKLEFGIHEDTTPANVRMRVNDGSGWSSYITLASAASGNTAYDLISGASVPKHNNNASEMDLTSYLSGTGWKHIEFSSSRLGLIAWNVILKLDITA